MMKIRPKTISYILLSTSLGSVYPQASIDTPVELSSGMSHSDFPFTLLALIGRGESAQVWQARHLISGHEVALKIFKAQGRSSNQVDEFFRETRFVARAAHQNILEVWGYGRSTHVVEHDGVPVLAVNQLYLVSEYVAGGSLEKQAGQLEWSEIRLILLDLLSGLARIHARGIVHLDLKPANVLRGERGPLISDFGVAAPIVSAELPQRDGGLFGTPSYMSPEQGVSHTHLYGPWTDLYGLGCLAVVLITGRTPYTTDGLVEQLIAHRSDPIPVLEGGHHLPKGFDLWLAGMMNKSWSRRFQRAVEARRYLESLALSESPSPHMRHAGIAASDTADILSDRDIGRSVDMTLAEQPWYECETIRLAAGQALHTAQQVITEGQSFAETECVSYDVVEAGARPATRLEGMGNSLIGIEDARLVGRETEKRSLWTLFSEYLTQPETGVVKINAAAGMGKTALCDWFSTAAHEFVGAEILWLTHAPTPGPSDGVLNAFRSYFSLFGVDKEGYARLIAQRLCLPEDDSLVVDLTRLFEVDFVDESTLEQGYVLSMYERLSTLSQLMIYLAVRRPMVVIIDDVQWAFDTLQFLSTYLKHSASRPIFMIETRQSDARVISARIDQLHAAFHERLPWTHSMDLLPLDRDSVLRWVQDSLGTRAPDSQSIVDSVAGNPLSIKALLYTAGTVSNDDDVLAHPSLETLLCRQFSLWQTRTPKISVLSLQVLAVLGRISRVEEWIGVMGRLGHEPDLAALTPAIEGQLIERDAHGQIIFVHRAILDAALSALNRADAVSMHKETAVFLEDEPSPDYARVATHYSQCHEDETAADRWFRTAILCRDRADYPNFRWALIKSANSLRTARVQTSDRRWVELGIYWVLCRRVMGEALGSSPRSKMNIARATASGDHRLIALALREDARLERVVGGYADALEPMADALSFALKTEDVALQTVLRTDLASLNVHTGDIDNAQQLLKQIAASLDTGFKGKVLRHSVEFFQLSSGVSMCLGHHEEALEFAQASYSAVANSPSKRSRGHALNLLGEVQRKLGQYAQAIESYEGAADCYCAIESIDTPITYLNQAFIHCEVEAFEKARACEVSARRWLGASSVITLMLCDFVDAILHLLMGELVEFEACTHILDALSQTTWGEVDLVRMAEIGINTSVERGQRTYALQCLKVFENQLERTGGLHVTERIATLRKTVERLR